MTFGRRSREARGSQASATNLDSTTIRFIAAAVVLAVATIIVGQHPWG